MAGGLGRVRPWVRARISKHNGDSRSSNKQIGEEEGSAALHASGLLWALDCAVHDQFNSAAWLPKSGGSGPKLLVVTQQQRSEDVQSI